MGLLDPLNKEREAPPIFFAPWLKALDDVSFPTYSTDLCLCVYACSLTSFSAEGLEKQTKHQSLLCYICLSHPLPTSLSTNNKH